MARLAASSGLRLLLPLPLDWLRLQFAPAASPFAFTGREPLGLRLVAPSPAEPLMHSLFQPNLASPAKPSMSIPFPPALASSGIFPVEQPWACALTCNLWCVQRSLCGLRLRFHPLSGLAAILRFSPAVHSVNLAGDQLPACAGCFFFQPSGNQLRCPNGSSVKETLRPINLWKQVQKSSKFVDFTNVGAEMHFPAANNGICSNHAVI